MDALAWLLDGPRARGAFLMRSVFDPPWSVRIQDHAPLTLVTMLHAAAWVAPDSAAPGTTTA
ncbi:cupin domain-containing protein [Micromonospora sp. NBC_01638]|uniref:cupin domain-containing protein n=1 Tax=Micromonospora sp. NBC_01638 TaxID=2975982 RepID=UPI003864C421